MLETDKHRKKIVLIGGSSVAFGLSAEQIEASTGIRTINIGHHAGFGLTDFQSFIMKNINKDDIIVFSCEWFFFSNPKFFDEGTLDNLIRYNPEYGRMLENDAYIRKSKFSKISFSFSDQEDPNSAYIYHCFNSNGDIISHCNLKAKGPKYYTLQHDSLQLGLFPKLFSFIQSNRTVFLFPPTQEKVYAENKAYLESIEEEVVKRKFTLCDKVSDNVYPDSFFYDNEYHLTCEARKIRTEKLIGFLKNKIINKP